MRGVLDLFQRAVFSLKRDDSKPLQNELVTSLAVMLQMSPGDIVVIINGYVSGTETRQIWVRAVFGLGNRMQSDAIVARVHSALEG